MNKITILTPAKINLSIDVMGRLKTGYHTVEMIMQSIGLYDIVTVKKIKSGISISCEHPYVPNNRRNIAWKAAEAFFAQYPEKGGAYIKIEKRIPVSSGLAGGSTNAAGVLKALNKLYGNFFSDLQLTELSRSLGADVAFCLNGGTQLARGIGDELTVLPDFTGVHLVLVKPSYPISTPFVYKNLDLEKMGERPDILGLINSITEFDIRSVATGMRNVLESVTIKMHPDLGHILNRFMEYGAIGSRMSGSGPTVFGLFEDEERAKFAKEQFKDYQFVCQTKTIGKGE